jgi:hypothetical protein
MGDQHCNHEDKVGALTYTWAIATPLHKLELQVSISPFLPCIVNTTMKITKIAKTKTKKEETHKEFTFKLLPSKSLSYK